MSWATPQSFHVVEEVVELPLIDHFALVNNIQYQGLSPITQQYQYGDSRQDQSKVGVVQPTHWKHFVSKNGSSIQAVLLFLCTENRERKWDTHTIIARGGHSS